MATADVSSSLSVASRVVLLALFGTASALCFYHSHRLRRRRRIISGAADAPPPRRGKLFFASQTGTSKSLALRLSTLLSSNGLGLDLLDPAEYEPEDLPNETLVLLVASTWEDGNPPPNAAFLARWLSESADDFRIGSLLLSRCRFAVFGVGSGSYGPTYNAAANNFSRWFKALGASQLLPPCEADCDDEEGLERAFDRWSRELLQVLLRGCCRGGDVPRSYDSVNGLPNGKGGGEEDDADDSGEDDYVDDSDADVGGGSEPDIVDLEDIAGIAPTARKAVTREENLEKEMVTPVIRASLEKQGYKIVGSHSGVKICRWTKSQLRGRGGCYKHSFYGIESHRCMEATPSLACANKCVFCWRHHTNPVGKSWRWKMDDPIEIVDTAINLHLKMIKQMKGVPGVKQERLSEGLVPRHCALSLVGEPIMYPEINTLVDELHRRRISTFLVTNAQFPERIRMLKPITQLYVSVDAATKDSLKAIDRPLFGDFWERFLESLKALHEKEQRTVYRLTLVKGWNTQDVDAYSQLLHLGKPDFVEIKGVTYCGSTATSKLTMDNVPWHADVKVFSEMLARKSNNEYEVACEHVHSCCVLLAKVNKFKIDGQWFTWIDYEKFHDLVASGKQFTSRDYMAATPSWAVFGAAEGGFDPQQSRYKKERRHGAVTSNHPK